MMIMIILINTKHNFSREDRRSGIKAFTDHLTKHDFHVEEVKLEASVQRELIVMSCHICASAGSKIANRAKLLGNGNGHSFEGELRGSQGTGVVSDNWFDRVLLSILYMFKPSHRPMLKPPSLGTPQLPLKIRQGGTSTFFQPSAFCPLWEAILHVRILLSFQQPTFHTNTTFTGICHEFVSCACTNCFWFN